MTEQKIITPNYDWYTYDVEVFAYDFIVVFKNKRTGEYTIFHNDNEGVRDFITDTAIYCGFNTKHYDQYIIKAICGGLSIEEIKQVNDWIIGGGQGWECPFLNGIYFRFNNVDVKDDVRIGLSLKAIEGHLGLSVVESEIDFSLERPLTPEEVALTIKYCKHDVDATEKLTDIRADYLKTKLNLGKRANIDPVKALSSTNAKLTAMMLGAVRQEWDDGRDYVYPPNLDLSIIPQEILNFFDTIHDMSIPDKELFETNLIIDIGGMPCKYAWGGVHGSLTGYYEETTENRVIQNRDVSSLYPSLIEVYKYLSRNVPDPQLFYDIRKDRIRAKHEGDKQTATDLKLPLNTVSGAQENKYNDLFDPLSTRSMRISGQLFLTMLTIQLLNACKTIRLLNLNTDGLMYSIDRSELPIVDDICSNWEKAVGFELETDEISKVQIKDVNNLLFVDTKGKIKTVGGYLNYGISVKGAWSINNNATIVKKALVEYFSKGTPPEETINGCDDIFSFQLIANAGKKYKEAYHLVDGHKEPIQKVNRVYATNDTRFGKLFKIKASDESTARIESLPEHCIIDNDNNATIENIDKTWYIELAKKRINDFLGIKPDNKRRKTKMATKKTETPIETSTLNIYQKLALVRKEVYAEGVKKSGINRHAEFEYFELEDIVPTSTPVFEKYNTVFVTTFPGDKAVGRLINLDNPTEEITVEFTATSIAEPAKFRMNEVQALGAGITYMRRYLYQLILDLVEKDEFDGTLGKAPTEETPKPTKPATPTERAEIKKEITNAEGNADELQLKALRTALSKLRELDPTKDEFIQEIALKTNGFTTIKKSVCEQLIINIGQMIANLGGGN